MGNSRRDLANLDPDIGQDWSRIIQDAFKNGLELSCDLIFGERLANRPEQGIYAGSAIQNYLLGTRRITPDGRVYRYGKCDQNLAAMNVGVKNWRPLLSLVDNICKVAIIGATVIEVAADAFTGTLLEDELRGGHISLYRGADRQQRHITHNTAVPVLAGATCFITIKDPLVTAMQLNDNCEIAHNPYSALHDGNHNYTAVMGMPTRLALLNEYFWIQTWGPCRISPEGAGYGDTENELQFVFGSTGGVITHREGEAYEGYSKQHAGYVMELASTVLGSVAPIIMLQISP